MFRSSAALVLAVASNLSSAQSAIPTAGSVHPIPVALMGPGTGTVHGRVTRADGLSTLGTQIALRSTGNSAVPS